MFASAGMLLGWAAREHGRHAHGHVIDKQIKQLSKGAQQMAHNIVLLQEDQAPMRSAIKELTKRKTRKRRYIRTEGTLIVSEVREVFAKQAGDSRGDGEEPSRRVQVKRGCGRYKEIRHNARTCMVDIKDASDSDSFIESISLLRFLENCDKST
jgi:hypothetical protein